MIRGPLEADGRMAAKNAVKIRAALNEVADFKKLYEQYQDTHPISTDKPAQDRARARAWAIMNVRLNDEPLQAALWRTWAEAYALGDDAAGEWIQRAIEAKKTVQSYIDWDNWKPGDKASAVILRKPKAYSRLLERTGVIMNEMKRTTFQDIGTSLADAVELGLDAVKASRLIAKHVASPSRALTIAITEQNRAMTAATIQRYKQAEINKVEWEVSDPCPKCAMNANQVREIGQPFDSGSIQPPAHPHCRCVLLPVIPGAEDDNGIDGSVGEGPTLGVPTPDLEDTDIYAPRRFEKGADEEIYAALKEQQGAYIESLTTEQLKSVAGYQAEGTYDVVNGYLRSGGSISASDKQLIKTLDKVIQGGGFDYNMTVYRGVSDDTGAFMNLKIGQTITDKAYISTSPNPAVAEAFANSTVIEGKPVVLEIDVPYGHPAIAADVASNRLAGQDIIQDDEMMIEITGFTRLNEVTLPRNTTFEVTEIIDKENARYVKVRIKK